MTHETEQMVLCVDDDRDFLKSLEFFLPEQVNGGMDGSPWYRFIFFTSAQDAIDAMGGLRDAGETVAMIITDQKMPEMTGTALLAESRQIFPDCARVLLTGHAGIEAAIEAINTRLLDRYLTKPIDDPIEFAISIQHLLQRVQMQATIKEQNRRLVRKTEELARANQSLVLLDRLKWDFLRFISHELRTPLVGMSTVSMLEPGQSPEEQRELIDMIRSGYQRLEGFIQAGLDYFEWLGAKRQDATEPVDVLDVLRAELARVEGGAPPRNVEISAPESSCWVPWNAELLAEVVRVLLENAVKFSEASQRIRVEVEASEGTVTLKVIDRGTGFEPEMGDELLRPLTIGNVMKHSQGTGLSLAKVSHMVTAHGGVMKAESPGLGLGATFSVTIPVECQDEAA